MGTFSKTFGACLVQQGALLNYDLPWTLLPYFSLTEDGLELIEGESAIIYGNTLINVPINNNLKVIYYTEIGVQSGNDLIINNPSAGTYSCTIMFKNGTVLIGTYNVNISVIAKTLSGTRSVLMVGNSLMNSGCNYYGSEISAILNACTIDFIGTKGTTTKHEGYSGASIDFFLSDPGSPFVKLGNFDVNSYFTDNSLSFPDLLFMEIGINDLFGNYISTDGKIPYSRIDYILNGIKTFINEFILLNPSIKIILALPTTTGSNNTAWILDYGNTYNQDLFIENVHKYHEKLVSIFANGNYLSNVDCSYEMSNINRNTHYDNVLNSGVHLNESGYIQYGKSMSLKINSFLFGNNIDTSKNVVIETFSSENGWANAVIIDNSLSNSATVYKNCDIVSQEEYVVSFTVKNYVEGSFYIAVGDSSNTPSVSSNGLYQYEITGGSNAYVYIYTGAFVGQIDNLIIRKK